MIADRDAIKAAIRAAFFQRLDANVLPGETRKTRNRLINEIDNHEKALIRHGTSARKLGILKFEKKAAAVPSMHHKSSREWVPET
jgi:hypothetical protein